MPKKNTPLDRFSNLTWNDLEAWAGGKIISRGKNYQQQGRVAGLAVTDEGSLIAWVNGSERYATMVDRRNRFPLIGALINIALLEKKLDQVLKWYDQSPKSHLGGAGLMKTPLLRLFKSMRRIGR